jgi:hypothetical protein
MIRRAVIVCALAAGCGPNTADVQKAKDSAYNTEFARVWNACDTELKDRFHADGLKIEDPERGLIETKWEPVETREEQSVGESNQRTHSTAGATAQRVMWRMMVKVLPGGPPWRIAVDGEAALYRAGMSMLMPYKHGAADEPAWVPNRIDSIVIAIHDRLKEYAVNAPPAQ